jgi:hypothetical protein
MICALFFKIRHAFQRLQTLNSNIDHLVIDRLIPMNELIESRLFLGFFSKHNRT